MSIEMEMPSSHLILCCPLLLLPPIPPSIRSMNQGKLEVVKQEMARVNVDILGISELKLSTKVDYLNTKNETMG